MPRFVLDTNLYIAAARDARWAEELDRFASAYLPFLYLHAVVVQEMLAGAIDARRERVIDESLIRPFEKRGRVVTPSYLAWKRAGQIVARLIQRHLLSPGGFGRSFINDCLLAASCYEQGIVIVTRNPSDYDLIRKVARVRVVEPWPS